VSIQISSGTPPISDNLTDFKAWAKVISDFMATAGWAQANDTGQAVWTATVLTCTQVAMAGTVATISYSSFAGPAPRVGMSITFSGFGNGGNNTALTITAVSGGGSGTVTAVNASGVNETHAGSGTTTAQAAVPASTATIYEVWVSTDALSSTVPMYLKLEYGQGSTANTILFALTAGTGSNGSGTLTGNVTSRYPHTPNTSSATPGESDLCGASGRLSIMMFRPVSNSLPFFFGVERSHDATGADTDAYWVIYLSFITGATRALTQQVINKPALGGVLTAETEFVSALTTLSSGVFGTSVALAPVFPVVGKLDNPTMCVAASKGGDIIDAGTVTVSMFGASHTFFCAKTTSAWTSVPRNTGTANALLFRWE
jgi:hypothetical protein